MKNISYTGSLQGIVLCQLDDRDLCKRRFNFGQFPIMVKVCSVFLWFRSLKLIKFCICLN